MLSKKMGSALQMCRDFTEHLIGKPLYEDATRALMKSRARPWKTG
jgi:hypothetical protein